ncbi:hypothetical protein GA0115252_107212 [Streptomyces sp. DfronAA-171]|nr:hypothetical protein GA0115252_107212 [Streptomyces sp. DfronAA-171]
MNRISPQAHGARRAIVFTRWACRAVATLSFIWIALVSALATSDALVFGYKHGAFAVPGFLFLVSIAGWVCTSYALRSLNDSDSG